MLFPTNEGKEIILPKKQKIPKINIYKYVFNQIPIVLWLFAISICIVIVMCVYGIIICLSKPIFMIGDVVLYAFLGGISFLIEIAIYKYFCWCLKLETKKYFKKINQSI